MFTDEEVKALREIADREIYGGSAADAAGVLKAEEEFLSAAARDRLGGFLEYGKDSVGPFSVGETLTGDASSAVNLHPRPVVKVGDEVCTTGGLAPPAARRGLVVTHIDADGVRRKDDMPIRRKHFGAMTPYIRRNGKWIEAQWPEVKPGPLSALRDKIHAMATDKGWWDDPRTPGEVIALCHSELSEALEEVRNGRSPSEVYENPDKPGKPEGVPVELADCMIRILDYFGYIGVDVDEVVSRKIAYNATRPKRHGGKVL